MENKGTLRLTLVTSDGEPLSENVEIRLNNQSLTDHRTVTAQATNPILIAGLLAFPHGLYQLEVFPAGCEYQSRFVNIAPDQTTDVCMVFHGAKEPPAIHGFQVDDTLTEADLTGRLRWAIAGSAATSDAGVIVWQDRGDEVVVHLSTLQVRLAAPAVFAAVDLESDQTGRGPLIVRFVFGDEQDPAGLFATTDEVVLGHPQLAARWGPIFRDLIWSALTRLSSDHAAERGLAPLRFGIGNGKLDLNASASIPLPDRVKQILNPPPKPPKRPRKGHDS